MVQIFFEDFFMSLLSFLFVGLLAATLLTLIFGLFSFLKGSAFHAKHGNATMQLRVMLQGLALLIFAILLWLGK